MADRLDRESRSILQFRPNIYYIEPEVGPGDIDPIDTGSPTSFDDTMAKMDRGKKLANAVDLLAAAIQARVDNLIKDKGMVIALDPNVDAAAVMALRRLRPEDKTLAITYDDYKKCKERQLARGVQLGLQSVISPEEFKAARKQVAKDGPLAALKEEPLTPPTEGGYTPIRAGAGAAGGFKSKSAQEGGNRPELNQAAQVVEPLNIIEFQIMVIKMLMNFLWKMFIAPFLCAILPFPVNLAVCNSDKLVDEKSDDNTESFIAAADGVVGKAPPTKQTKNKKDLEDIEDAGGMDPPPLAEVKVPEGTTSPLEDPFPITPKPDGALGIQDCMTITKTYERGCAYSTKEESVYALLTPYLNTQRSLANSFKNQIASFEGMVHASAIAGDPGLSGDGGAPVEDDDGPTWEAAAEWLKDCIPCMDRFNAIKPAAAQLGSKLWDALTGPFAAMYEYFKQILQQLKDLLMSLFTPAKDRFADICALWNWLKDFVCIPDFTKIIAALMALLMKLAMEISSLFDLLLTLVAPLMMPVLGGLTGIINAFLNLVLAPIDCIIDALITQINKLDYRELFATGKTNVNIGFGKGRSSDSDYTFGSVSTGGQSVDFNPVGIDAQIPAFETPALYTSEGWEGQTWGVGYNGTISPFEWKQLEQEEALREADKELQSIRSQRSLVDWSSDAERQEYQKKLQEAKQKREDAAYAAHGSWTDSATKWLSGIKRNLHNVVQQLVSYLREIIDSIQAWFTGLVAELQKMLGALTGQGQTMGLQLLKKLEILQLLNFLYALIPWLTKGGPAMCDNLEDVMAAEARDNATKSNAMVVTDENGAVTIYENPDELAKAIDAVILAQGVIPGEKPGGANLGVTSPSGVSSATPTDDPAGTGTPDATANPGTSLDRSRQKLNSLIELTGDPVLDTTIGQAVNALVTPKKTTYKCPYLVQRSDVEKVNQWMDELNAS